MDPMKLSKAQLLVGLNHPKIFVRQVILKHFEEARDTDPEVTRHAQEVIDHFGWTKAFHWPHQVARLPLDETTLDWVVRQLARKDDQGPKETLPFHLARRIAKSDVEILRPRLDEILALDMFAPEEEKPHRQSTREHLLQRMANADRSPAECWQRLEELCHSISSDGSFPHAQIGEGELLVERIADDGLIYVDKILQSLQHVSDPDSESSFEDWQCGLMAKLAGKLRLEEAAEPLLRMFEADWDWYNEEAQKALKAIGTPATAQTVAQHYPQAVWHSRLYSTGVLEAIHHTDAVEMILPLIETEEEDDLRCMLGIAIVSHFDQRAIEPAMKIYNEDPEDPEREEILSRVFACTTLMELDKPEADVWHMRLQKSQDRSEESRQNFDRVFGSYLKKLIANPKIDRYDESDDDWLVTDASEEYERLPPTEPIVREGVRIGRNEPCPCGSGKKYKKCCLRTESSAS